MRAYYPVQHHTGYSSKGSLRYEDNHLVLFAQPHRQMKQRASVDLRFEWQLYVIYTSFVATVRDPR